MADDDAIPVKLPEDDAIPVTMPGAAAAVQGTGAPDWLSSLLSTTGDVAASAGTGAVKGLATTPGMLMDLVHLAQLGAGKATGNEDWQQAGREGLGGGVGGSAWLEHKLAEAGVNYVPRTEAGRWADVAGNFAGGAIGAGGVGGVGRGLLKAGVEGATKLGLESAVPKMALRGAAAVGDAMGPNTAVQIAKQGLTGAGAGLGWKAADTAVEGTDSPWLHAGADIAGSLVGGGLAGGIHNLASRPLDKYSRAYADLGVTPRFPSDVNRDGGAINAFLSKTIPSSYGAQGVSKESAQMTQRELSEGVQGALGMGHQTPEGFVYSSSPTYSGQLLKDAKQPLLPGQTDPGAAQMRDLIKLGTQPDPASAIGTKFNLDKFMTEWSAMPRDERLRMLSPPPGTSLLPQAQQDALRNQSNLLTMKMNSIATAYEGTTQSRALAEKAVQDALHSSSAYGLPGLAGAAAGIMGEGLSGVLGYSAATAGAKTAGAQLAARVGQRWLPGVTGFMSRPLASSQEAMPTSMAIQNSGKFLGPGAIGADQAAIGAMPDTYQPPPQVPPKTSDLHSWLGSMDRGTATALVSSKLGPQLGQQLAQAGSQEQYGAALMNLSADPRYRQMLQG